MQRYLENKITNQLEKKKIDYVRSIPMKRQVNIYFVISSGYQNIIMILYLRRVNLLIYVILTS